MLTERRIAHLVRSYRDSALDGLFQVQMGWGVLDGPADRRDLIEQVCTDVLATKEAPPVTPEETGASPVSAWRWLPLGLWALITVRAAAAGRLVLFGQVGVLLVLGLLALQLTRARTRPD